MLEEIRNAVIESTRLTVADHGVLSSWIYLDYGGAGQGFGGYCLATNPSRKGEKGVTHVCGLYLWRLLEIAGVDDYEKLPGRPIRVKATHNGITSIGHYLKDDWFTPKEDLCTQ